MEKGMASDLNKLLDSYTTEPLAIGGQQYGNKFVSESGGRAVIVTDSGEQLYSQTTSILLDSLLRTQSHEKRCILTAGGEGGEVYRVALDSGAFAEKRYKRREDGITQIQDLANADFWTRDLPRVRTPKTYFASTQTLFMEFVNAPTWEQLVKVNPGLDEKLKDAFYESGGMERLLEKNMEQKEDSILVETDPKTGDYGFVIIDPVIRYSGSVNSLS